MGKFIITKRANGEFQFSLKAGNGQEILASEGYKTKDACEGGISSVKRNSQDDSKFDLKKSKNDKFYFNLKATNGQIIGTSEMYETETACKNGIESVRKNAADALIEDKSN